MFSAIAPPVKPAAFIRSNGDRPSWLLWSKKWCTTMSVACRSAALVSALLVRSGPQPFLARSLLVSCSTCASAPPVGAGGLVVGGLVDGFGVAVWLGRGVGLVVGFGERVPCRLGALVERVGVGVGVALGVFDGDLEGV